MTKTAGEIESAEVADKTRPVDALGADSTSDLPFVTVLEFGTECHRQAWWHRLRCFIFLLGGSLLFIRIPGIDDDLKRTAPLGLLSLFCAAYSGFNWARRHYGRLLISNHELQIEPEWCGFSLNWSSLEDWEVATYETGEAPDVLLWGKHMHRPFAVPSDWLCATDISRFIECLERYHPKLSSKTPEIRVQ